MIQLTNSPNSDYPAGVIPRLLQPKLRSAARHFPVVTVTGPRQSGKTTLCRATFPRHAYVSLEPPDARDFARTDPRGFLRQYGAAAVIDEVQRVPELLSYLQGEVDIDPAPGRFILTGSANIGLLQAVTQSLAGRTALLNLLPCSLAELREFPAPPTDLLTTLWSGSYPAVFDRGIPPDEWFASYVATYVERDVRQILNIGDLSTFQTFLRLAAGRTGQLLNLSQLGADTGINHNTARAWLSVLEAGFIAYRLPALRSNLGKRLVATPKLHSYDAGLVCSLLGIRSPQQLETHPLRGAIFETWVAGEILKARLHRGLSGGVFFYRDRKGLEVDLIAETGEAIVAIEAKSGRTVATDFFDALERFAARHGTVEGGRAVRRVVVYGGDEPQRRREATVVPWFGLDTLRVW